MACLTALWANCPVMRNLTRRSDKKCQKTVHANFDARPGMTSGATSDFLKIVYLGFWTPFFHTGKFNSGPL